MREKEKEERVEEKVERVEEKVEEKSAKEVKSALEEKLKEGRVRFSEFARQQAVGAQSVQRLFVLSLGLASERRLPMHGEPAEDDWVIGE